MPKRASSQPDPQRERMKSDVAKYEGKQSSYSVKRPSRKILSRYSK